MFIPFLLLECILDSRKLLDCSFFFIAFSSFKEPAHSPDIRQTLLLDMLTMPAILQMPPDISAGYVCHACSSPNVLQTPLLDMLAMPTPRLVMLAMPTIPPMSGRHICWICWPCLQFLQCLANTSAGFAGHAYNSLNVFGTSLLDVLAMPTIP